MGRILPIFLLITALSAGQDWAARMDSLVGLEWQAMSQANKDTVWAARAWGVEHGFKSLGAIYANEDRGKMGNVRPEVNGDESAGPGQNLVRHAAIRTFGKDYTLSEYTTIRDSLRWSLNFSLEQSWEHIKLGLNKFDYIYEVWKYYNGQNAPTDSYPANVLAWDRFLDKKYLELAQEK